MRFRLIPTDDKFFELFASSAGNAAECARRLRDLLTGDHDALAQVIACEQRGDALLREILERLGTSFVTPFDREDIHSLAEELDDVVDDMTEVAYRFDLGPKHLTPVPELLQQVEILIEMVDETVLAVSKLHSMKGTESHLASIDRLESQGDAVYRAALARFYAGEMKARESLFWKDLVDALEEAMDAVEDASDVIEAIVFKHA